VTDLLYLRDAYARRFSATVIAVDGSAVELDRTLFYPTGGGQPHDTGLLAGVPVVEVRKSGEQVWHTLGDGPVPAPGDVVEGEIDWDRRHRLMRTHTAMHVLCGVIWNEWRVPVTGGNMEPLSARMDFEFDPLPEGFAGSCRRTRQRRDHGRSADRGAIPPARHSGARRGSHPDEGVVDPGERQRDPCRRHRRPRQAGRRWDARRLDEGDWIV